MTAFDANTDLSAPRASVAPLVLIYAVLALLIALLAVAVVTWGLVALAMGALALVPVMFVILILISRG